MHAITTKKRGREFESKQEGMYECMRGFGGRKRHVVIIL